MNLRDALASALRDAENELVEHPGGGLYYDDMVRLLWRDPTFRAALVEAVAEAMSEAAFPATGSWATPERYEPWAAAIVARMLDPKR